MDVCDWLRDFLKDGPRTVEEVRFAAKAMGYTRGDLKDARLICGVVTTNNWSRYNPADTWYWSLPEDLA